MNRNTLADIIGLICLGVPPLIPFVFTVMYLAPVGFWQCVFVLFIGFFSYFVCFLLWIFCIDTILDVIS